MTEGLFVNNNVVTATAQGIDVDIGGREGGACENASVPPGGEGETRPTVGTAGGASQAGRWAGRTGARSAQVFLSMTSMAGARCTLCPSTDRRTNSSRRSGSPVSSKRTARSSFLCRGTSTGTSTACRSGWRPTEYGTGCHEVFGARHRPARRPLGGVRCSSSALSGPASVTDGDTLRDAGRKVRLHGIDASESRQTHVIGGKHWRFGARGESNGRRKGGTGRGMSQAENNLWSDIHNTNNDANMDDWANTHDPNNDDYLGDDNIGRDDS